MNWISVNDQLPPEHQWVLMGNSDNQHVELGIFLDGKFVQPDLHYKHFRATDWMPLPDAPQKKEEDKVK